MATEQSLKALVLGGLVAEGVVRQEEVDDTLQFWDEPTILQFAAQFPESQTGQTVAKNEVGHNPVLHTDIARMASQLGLRIWQVVYADGTYRYDVHDIADGTLVLSADPFQLGASVWGS